MPKRAIDVLQDFFLRYTPEEQDALITLVEPPLGVLLTHIRVQIQGGAPVREACRAALAPDSENAQANRERKVKVRA